MEKLSCWNCKNSRTNLNPKTIQEINNDCKVPLILKDLELDEHRINCPHFNIIITKGSWICCESSGYDGYKCIKCGTWIYKNDHLKCICDKEE